MCIRDSHHIDHSWATRQGCLIRDTLRVADGLSQSVQLSSSTDLLQYCGLCVEHTFNVIGTDPACSGHMYNGPPIFGLGRKAGRPSRSNHVPPTRVTVAGQPSCGAMCVSVLRGNLLGTPQPPSEDEIRKRTLLLGHSGDQAVYPQRGASGRTLLSILADDGLVLNTDAVHCGHPGFACTHEPSASAYPVSYTHLRAHETVLDLVCRLLLEKKKKQVR
eukprot:TRINITY_DN3481_c0_g2_i2.p1 TRINITY_DN3481_c0_g2~~TRINITY_DN3481_c0_g2_i2.p1  ORF type:complete len:218 (-),score=60.30 TRINITY_DN3481_c0_g2_i2:109-762(-)